MSAGISDRDELLCLDDGVEPEQFAAMLHSRWRMPEQRFLLALLLDTYRLLFVRKGEGRGRNRPSEVLARHNAIQWVRDRRVTDSPYGFSFSQLCDELGLPTRVIRRKFVRWYIRQEQKEDIRNLNVNYAMTRVVAPSTTERKHQKRSAA